MAIISKEKLWHLDRSYGSHKKLTSAIWTLGEPRGTPKIEGLWLICVFLPQLFSSLEECQRCTGHKAWWQQLPVSSRHSGKGLRGYSWRQKILRARRSRFYWRTLKDKCTWNWGTGSLNHFLPLSHPHPTLPLAEWVASLATSKTSHAEINSLVLSVNTVK